MNNNKNNHDKLEFYILFSILNIQNLNIFYSIDIIFKYKYFV